MKEKIIKILQWILCAFMAILALAFIPSVASIFLALFCVVLIPVEKVQALWKKFGVQGVKKISVLALLFLVAVFMIPESPNEGKYEGELTLDFLFGTRTGVYSGEVDRNGLPNGQGTFTSQNQDGETWTYEGDWVAGHWKGHGTSTWWDGRVYTGEFTNDSETGYGTVTTNTGEKYEGTFISGTIHGEGTFYNTDGTKFVGTFTDFKNAIGTYHDKDGISYEAIIKDGYLSWQQTEKNESENTQQPEAQSAENTGNSESQNEEELVGSDLFENVYVPYAQREGRVFAFEAVKTFAENCGYNYKLSEPSEDEESLTYIKIMDGDDYVYFAFSPDGEDILVQSLCLVSYHQAKSNSEVGMSNYSKDRTANYDSFKTHVIGEKEKQVTGVKEQREFLFKN